MQVVNNKMAHYYDNQYNYNINVQRRKSMNQP